MAEPSPGRVTLVGAGPGDPQLLTLAGRAALESADVVIHDYLVHPGLLDLAPPGALRVFAGKRKGQRTIPQEQINDLLVAHARAGRHVVRLKGGDPLVFGRGAEEAEHARRHGIEVRIIPGVTAAVGVAAYAGLPITHRDDASAVVFLTGHVQPATADQAPDWNWLARFPGTIVFYMASSRLDAIKTGLIEAGMSPATPAALVQWGTLPRQRTVLAPLSDLADRVREAGAGPPALLVVGSILRHRPELSWFERLPLFGRRIVVTRPESEATAAAQSLEALGAEVLLAPTVRLLPLEDPAPLDAVLNALEEHDWLAFTSPAGVRHFVDRLPHVGRDLRALGHLKLAAIGPATAAALAAYHLRADVVPGSHRSEDLAAALLPLVAGQRLLLARADRGRTVLNEALATTARAVTQVAVYRNVDADALPPQVVERLREGSVDWITLTSSAIAERLLALLPTEARTRLGLSLRLASLSPLTSATVRRLGHTVAAEAPVETWTALVQAIIQAESLAPGLTPPRASGELSQGAHPLPDHERPRHHEQDIEHQAGPAKRDPQRRVEQEDQGQ